MSTAIMVLATLLALGALLVGMGALALGLYRVVRGRERGWAFRAAGASAASFVVLIALAIAVAPPTPSGEPTAAREPAQKSEPSEKPVKNDGDDKEKIPAPETFDEESKPQENQQQESQPQNENPPAADGEVTAVVTDVVDGDTFDIDRSIQGMDRVRLIGVDTPEVFFGEEPCGREASDFTTRRLEGQQVTLEIGEDPADDYDRLLAYVFVGDELFNETLVYEGLAEAKSYPPNTKYDSDLEVAEAVAAPPECASEETKSASASASATATATATATAEPSGGSEDKLNNGIDDVNCEDLPGPVAVPPGDEDNLDTDDDGTGCDT